VSLRIICFVIAASVLGGISGCGGGDPASPPADTVAPDAIVDLTAVAGTAGTVTFTFTAPGDDATAGQTTAYEFRAAVYPAATTSWTNWEVFPVTGSPASAGNADTVTVTGLTADLAYVFRMRARDEMANWSEPSNCVVATANLALDTTPPASVVDLGCWAGDG